MKSCVAYSGISISRRQGCDFNSDGSAFLTRRVYWNHCKLRWDARRWKFVGDAEANTWARPAAPRTVAGAEIMRREEAWSLLNEFTKSESLLKHALAVEAALRRYAAHSGEDQEQWGVTGLLH